MTSESHDESLPMAHNALNIGPHGALGCCGHDIRLDQAIDGSDTMAISKFVGPNRFILVFDFVVSSDKRNAHVELRTIRWTSREGTDPCTPCNVFRDISERR